VLPNTSKVAKHHATSQTHRRAYNNWLHDFCRAAAGRVFGAASIDLRDAEEAAREARRCVKEFGFKAVQLNPVPVCGFCQLSGQRYCMGA
jgi:predicted TIM-barrel fold metal-dependent hydrolase